MTADCRFLDICLVNEAGVNQSVDQKILKVAWVGQPLQGPLIKYAELTLMSANNVTSSDQ